MVMRKKKTLNRTIQQQEAEIERMKTAINAYRLDQQTVNFVIQRCNDCEQIDSLIECENGVFVITVSVFYDNNGLTENIQFCGYVQSQDGTFSKTHMLHSHLFYHKTYRFLECIELCCNFPCRAEDDHSKLITEAFLEYAKRLRVNRVKYLLPKSLDEYRRQKNFYESLGFYLDEHDLHEMWFDPLRNKNDV